VAHDGSALDEAESTTVVNSLLHPLFIQWCLSTVPVSSFKDLYNCRAYLENLLAYGHDAPDTHLANPFWYPDDGNFLTHNPPADTTNRG